MATEPVESEGQTAQKDLQKTRSPETLQINPLVTALAATQIEINSGNQQLITNLKAVLQDKNRREPAVFESDDKVKAEAENIYSKAIPDEEFMEQSARMLGMLRFRAEAKDSAYNQQTNEISALETEKEPLENTLLLVNASLDKLNGQRFGRIRNHFQIKKIGKEHVALLSQITNLRQQIQAKINEASILDQNKRTAEHYIEELRLNRFVCVARQAKEQVASIEENYSEFLWNLLKEGDLTRDVESSYFSTIIPQIEEILLIDDERVLTENRRVKKSLAARQAELKDKRKESWKDYRERLIYNLPDYAKARFQTVDRLLEPLIRGDVEKITQRLVASLAISDLHELQKETQRLGLQDSLPEVAGILDEAEKSLKIEAWGKEKAEEEMDSDEGGQINLAPANNSGLYFNDFTTGIISIDMWDAFRSSKEAQAVFPELITRTDREIYSTLKEKGLSKEFGDSSAAIGLLHCYPNPETIRYLALLASADEGDTLGPQLAERELKKMTARNNYKDLLDQAELSFPELKFIRSELEQGNGLQKPDSLPKTGADLFDIPKAEYVGGYPGIVKFALATLEKESDNQLVELALHALPNDILLDRLSTAGIITQENANTIKQGVEDIEKVMKSEDMATRILVSEFAKTVRNRCLALSYTGRDTLSLEQKTDNLKAMNYLTSLAKRISENSNNITVLLYLDSHEVINLLNNQLIGASASDKKVALLLDAYKKCPALLGKQGNILRASLTNHTSQFLNEKGLAFLQEVTDKYTPTGFELNTVLDAIIQNHLPWEMAALFPEAGKRLLDKKMQGTSSFIFHHSKVLLKDSTDIIFLDNLVGRFNKKADDLIRGYYDCVKAGVLIAGNKRSKDIFLEFTGHFRVAAPALMAGYISAKERGAEQMYLAELKSLAEKMTGSGTITDEERAKPYYLDLIKAVYPHNSGRYTSYENNQSCGDRSSDLADFKIRSRYEIDLMAESRISIREGQVLNQEVMEGIKNQILAIAARAENFGYDNEKFKEQIGSEMDILLQKITAGGGGLKNVDIKTLSIEDKLFLILLDSSYGTKLIDPTILKPLLISYEFAAFEDIRDYIRGTTDRVSEASNQDYALLCELDNFFADRIKEVSRGLVQSGWSNPTLSALLPDYFKNLTKELTTSGKQDQINRLQVGKLGETDSFINQVRRILEERTGKPYPAERVRKIIKAYESRTAGLTAVREIDKTRTEEQRNALASGIKSKEELAQSFYGQLRAQRLKTLQAVELLTGERINPKDIHLGEINLEQLLQAQKSIQEGEYNAEQFGSYTAQQIIDLFREERNKIETELAKFKSESGKERKILHSYITKSKESANARMVGGVCVSGDNPAKSKAHNQWDMPNYLQKVLQDPETLQCQGVILMHYFVENGQKILTASFNPSSTYLYSVDEEALFNGITGELEVFAGDNNIDIIAISQHKTIRTNRTGGNFEKAMDKRVAKVGKKFTFSKVKQFSYHPPYQIQDMDIIWQKAA